MSGFIIKDFRNILEALAGHMLVWDVARSGVGDILLALRYLSTRN